MQTISVEHGFWAKMMNGAHEQYAGDYDTSEVVKTLSTSSVSPRRDPCNAATKGFRDATFTHFGPIIDTSRPGRKHEHEQMKVKEFFYRYPTPARVEVNVEDDDLPTIPVLSSTSTVATHTHPASQNAQAKDIPPPVKFYTQLLETLKTMKQVPPNQQKNVVESRKHEESVDLVKLQTSMLKLFYVSGEIDWDEGAVKNVTLATFPKGFQDLLGRTATVQEVQFANLLNTIFRSLPDDDDDELANPL
jgi:hypothetical protein